MSNGRIMIVEDESLVAEDLHNCLMRSGYDVVGVADSYASAKALAEQARPDLALLDIRLKGALDGIELASELRRNNIGYVYLTSHSDESTLARAEQTEPLGYVLKPFGMREMLPTLRTAMYRHLAELRLRNMEQWLRLTLSSIGDGVLVTDAETRVTYANPVAERMLGHGLREIGGEPLRDVLRLFAAGSVAQQECVAMRVIASGAEIHLDPDVELVRADGSRLPIDDCAAPIREQGGSITGVVIVMRDGTERRRLEQDRLEAERRLQDAQRLESLGVLASGLAHDLNNMLTAILGNAALCRDVASAEAGGPLAEIEANTRAAAEMCRRMLSGAGAAPVDPQPVDLAAVVGQCVARERALAVPGLRFEVGAGSPGRAVLGDAMQVQQVLQNLLRNAVEALVGRDGTIRVSWTAVDLPYERGPLSHAAAQLPAGRYVRMDVSDDGPGMPADVLPRIFEPFFTTIFTGRGLGLASVHGIVRRHGGAIEVDSSPGAGTRFRLHWPAVVLTAAPTTTVRSLGRVLIVDDDDAVRNVTCKLLSMRGWHCEASASGEEAVALLERGVEVDGVLLDMTMPGLSTDRILERVRLLHPTLPILLVSGNMLRSEDRPRDPWVDFLPKPFDVRELLTRLAAWRRDSN